MLFNSFSFAIFMVIIFIIYWIIPNKYRWLLILISSYYFYMSWNANYIVLILFTTFISYIMAILIGKQENQTIRDILLFITIVTCIGVLFYFKYFNFLSESITNFLNLFSIQLNPITIKVLLPVGISFYTFQTLSYVIDVYKRKINPEKHFGIYATFISFFPQLVAGPIERTSNLLPQIKLEHIFNYKQATYGLKLMAWGYFKKVVIADTLSIYVSKIYDFPQNYYGFSFVLATVFFAIQIYCDFSGYSDIAIGSAKLLGINLIKNFNSPYFSKSTKEFWGRWHISLSNWFRDYIYIPLGGNRVSKFRHYLNLLITFLISGLWHGANWTFVIWGFIHGMGQILENLLNSIHKSKKKNSYISVATKMIFTFIFVCFAWIFFVSNSIDDAIYVISHIFIGIENPMVYLKTGFDLISMNKISFVYICLSIMILMIYDYISLNHDVIEIISKKKATYRWCIYCLFALWIIINIPNVSASEFIYFQF